MSKVLNRVVVWDPKNEFWEGSLIEIANEPKLVARGAVILPCDPELFRRGGSSGLVKRAWGAGYPLDLTPRMVAPLSMLCFANYNTVHWAARLLGDATFDKEEGPRPGGVLRFISDGSREMTHHAAFEPRGPAVDVRELGPKDQYGGWTIRGTSTIRPHTDGHYGFTMYGWGPGLRIVWVAATLTNEGI